MTIDLSSRCSSQKWRWSRFCFPFFPCLSPPILGFHPPGHADRGVTDLMELPAIRLRHLAAAWFRRNGPVVVEPTHPTNIHQIGTLPLIGSDNLKRMKPPPRYFCKASFYSICNKSPRQVVSKLIALQKHCIKTKTKQGKSERSMEHFLSCSPKPPKPSGAT